MMHPSERNPDSSDGKLPWWAFPLAAVALVLAPPNREDGRQVAAKRQDSDPAVVGHRGDKRGRAASTPSEIPPKGWKDILWLCITTFPSTV